MDVTCDISHVQPLIRHWESLGFRGYIQNRKSGAFTSGPGQGRDGATGHNIADTALDAGG